MTTDFITVVTGLPRSGTSLMMQMLRARGLPILTDDARDADEHNPLGYFEYEPVKKLRSDSSWLDKAGGRVVKIVVPLIMHLPAGSYRVIFMERAMSEILASQTTMLEGLGRQGAGLTPERLGTIFGNQLSAAKQWLAARDDLRSQYFEYKDIVEGPAKASAALNAFLGGGLDEQAMAATVKPELYRQR